MDLEALVTFRFGACLAAKQLETGGGSTLGLTAGGSIRSGACRTRTKRIWTDTEVLGALFESCGGSTVRLVTITALLQATRGLVSGSIARGSSTEQRGGDLVIPIIAILVIGGPR
jgi:hypothetical protein